MGTLLIILLGTVLIQGSAIAGQPLRAVSARGVFADEFRAASFTLVTLSLASVYGFVITHEVLQPLQLYWLTTPVIVVGVAIIFMLARALLENIPGAIRWPDLLAHLTSQCAMLGLALYSATQLETIHQALLYGSGAATMLALLSASFAALRERMESADIPMAFRGIPLALITAGFMALALMGFAGMVQQ
jgi:Na+-translocating ferredoxin:NAD+ oxidoreductase subunit A